MEKILATIEALYAQRKQTPHRTGEIERMILAIRLHALCDAYVMLGGDDTKWRTAARTLKND